MTCNAFSAPLQCNVSHPLLIEVQRSNGLLLLLHNALMHSCKCLRRKGEVLYNYVNTVSSIPAWLLKVTCEVQNVLHRAPGPGLPEHLHL